MSLRIIASVSRMAIRANTTGSSAFTVPRLDNCAAFLSLSKIIFPVAQRFASTLPDMATYEEVKNLPNHPEKLLIDVREPNELVETGFVPTAINIPLGQVKEKLANDFPGDQFEKLFKRKKPTAETEIIFMCKIGVRSGKATDASRQLGYTKARNYLGSWTEWAEKEGLQPK